MPNFIHSIISFVLLFLFVLTAQAQQLKVVSETDRFTDYHFVNDSLDIVHVYEFLVQSESDNIFSITEQQTVTRTIDRDPDGLIEAFALSSNNTSLFDVVNPGIHRGNQTANLRFHPARYNENNPRNADCKRSRFRVYKSSSQRQTQRTSARLVQDERSPLADGDWYKIPFDEKGIYQIDAGYLEDLGINVNQLNPDHIQIWGIPGGELPRLNSAERPQLAQIPIIVEDGDNGSFDAGDRILFYADSPHQVFRDNDNFSHQLHRYSNNHHIYLRISADGDSQRLSAQSAAGAESLSQSSGILHGLKKIYINQKRESGRALSGMAKDSAIHPARDNKLFLMKRYPA